MAPKAAYGSGCRDKHTTAHGGVPYWGLLCCSHTRYHYTPEISNYMIMQLRTLMKIHCGQKYISNTYILITNNCAHVHLSATKTTSQKCCKSYNVFVELSGGKFWVRSDTC